MNERVVITGIGAFTPAGNVASTRLCLERGHSAITSLDPPFIPEVTVAGQVRDFDPNIYLTRKEQGDNTRDVHLAVGAIADALSDAGFINSPLDLMRFQREKGEKYNSDALWLNSNYLASRVGVEIGTAVGGSLSAREAERDSKSILRLDISQSAGTSARIIGARGPSNVRVNACASSIISLGEAFEKIRGGKADLILAGGSEAANDLITFIDFHRMRALSKISDPGSASRPLDQKLPGLVISEGSAMFVVEKYTEAKKRGACIYGEILGFGQTTDTSSAFVPDGFAIEEAMNLAIRRSRLGPEDFKRISLHASGTKAGDPQEVMAVRRVLGSYFDRPYIETPKSTFGHSLGAIGAMAILRILLENKYKGIYRNPNIDNPIEEAQGMNLPDKNTQLPEFNNAALINGIGLEGVNASLVITTA